jgi:hypothetical protein
MFVLFLFVSTFDSTEVDGFPNQIASVKSNVYDATFATAHGNEIFFMELVFRMRAITNVSLNQEIVHRTTANVSAMHAPVLLLKKSPL